jgi:hypothetical protein
LLKVCRLSPQDARAHSLWTMTIRNDADTKWKEREREREREREWKLTKCHQQSVDNKIIKNETDNREEEEHQQIRIRLHHPKLYPSTFSLEPKPSAPRTVYGSQCLDPDGHYHVANKLFSLSLIRIHNYTSSNMYTDCCILATLYVVFVYNVTRREKRIIIIKKRRHRVL